MSIFNTKAIVGIITAIVGLTSLHVFSAEVIEVDGSSTVFPITEAVAEEYQIQAGGTRVTVGISGTGGGFKRFCRGETDITNASRPILKEEMIACSQAGIKYYELPIAYDALTIIVTRQNAFVDHLTISELKTMWEPAAHGKINNWNQIRPSFPDQPLKLAGAGTDSGTFDYFTEAVVGRAKASRGDYQASEDDNFTVQFVSRNKDAIGYVGLAYYEENTDKLRAVPIVSPKSGDAVSPSVESVNEGTYQPLSRPMFIYVKEESLSRPEVREFVEFYLTEGGALASEVGYIGLPESAYEMILNNLRSEKMGSIFGGTPEIGLTIEDLLTREGKL